MPRREALLSRRLGWRQKGGAAVQSRITHFKPGIGTLAPDGIPLFGKWFDETHHPELVEGEGLGEIF